MLFQNPEEVLHRAAPVPDVADLLCDRILLGFGLLELLAEGIEALVVLGLVLRDRSVLPDHLLDHAVEHFHLRKELLLLGLQLGGVEGLCHAQLVGGNGGVPSGQQLVDCRREALLLLGVILVFLVMAAQFESFVDPFVILFSIPFGISGVLFGLFIMGKTLSMPAFLGMIILVGIVVNNAIVLIDYMKQVKERDSLTTNEALIYAGGKRLRPILMTAMTTIFGMVPMMLMGGEGSAMFSPLGTAVVFGLTVSTFITLILVPSVYSLVDSILVKLHLR